MSLTMRGPAILGDDPTMYSVAQRMFSDCVEEGPFDHDNFGRELPDETHQVIWAVVDGEVVGFATFKPTDENATWLELVYVQPDFRRQGIGRALFKAFIAASRAEGVGIVLTGTRAGNVAMADFVRRQGWAEVGITFGQVLTQ